jgi:hypothetical protein
MAAPPGNKFAAKGKMWFDALRKECVQRDALSKLATVVVDEALKGERWAVEEIGNRLDGKPAQGIEVSGTAEELDARIAELKAKLAAWGA